MSKPPCDVLNLFNDKTLVKACAPMVRYTKLQFRNLVKRYGCDLTFTPMIMADSFCISPKARLNEFTTNLEDTALITQFAANTVHDFVGASYLVAPYCDGVDLNCGCPQRWARELQLGCEMLNNPQKIFELVRECRNRITKPFTISVKTRILGDLSDSVSLCRGLEKSGVSFITIHARTPTNNVGPINEGFLKCINDSVQIPVIGNGGLGSLDECVELQERTGVKGVMVANAILTNPELFTGQTVTSLECVQNWVDLCYNSTLTLDGYQKASVNLVRRIPERPYNLTFQFFHHHLVFMLEKVLVKKQRKIFNNLKTFSSVLDFLEQSLGITPQLFTEEHFLQTLNLDLSFQDRQNIFEELKPCKGDIELSDYNLEQSDGNYFRQKLYEEGGECDWSSIFYENG